MGERTKGRVLPVRLANRGFGCISGHCADHFCSVFHPFGPISKHVGGGRNSGYRLLASPRWTPKLAGGRSARLLFCWAPLVDLAAAPPSNLAQTRGGGKSGKRRHPQGWIGLGGRDHLFCCSAYASAGS